MRTSDKVLLSLLALVNYAVAVLVILAEFVTDSFRPLSGILSFTLHNEKLELACYIFVIIFTVIMGTSLLTIVSRSSKYRLINRNDTLSLNDDSTGSSEITFEAIRVMAKKKCLTFRFVADCSTDVDVKDGRMLLYVRLRPYPDTVLTEAVQKMKDELSKSIEQQTGLTVGYIKILVLPYKARKTQ